jgi:hypothetical protein
LPPLGTHLGYAADPPLVDDQAWTGYIGNLASVVVNGQTVTNNAVFQPRFAIDIPDEPDLDHDETEFASTDAYNVAIPQDELTETAL